MSQYTKYSAAGGGGSANWRAPVATAANLPASGNTVGDAIAAEDTGIIYVWTGSSWDTAVGGVGTVTSVGLSAPSILSVAGSPVTSTGTLALSLATQAANLVFAGPTSGGDAAPTFRALVAADIPVPTGTPDTVAGFDSSGDLQSIPSWYIGTDGGPSIGLSFAPNGGSGTLVNADLSIAMRPLQNTPNENYIIQANNATVDPDSNGFDMGTGGDFLWMINNNIQHPGTSDTGRITFINNTMSIGNGTDPITVEGIGYAFGFGTIDDNVTINGYMQGYGYQPTLNAGVILSGYTNAFYDSATYNCAAPSYVSYSATPTLAEISNNGNYTAFNINPTITDFTGNSGFNGVAVAGQLGTLNTGSFNGVNVSPNITLNKSQAYGLFVNMNNVTNYAGVKSSVVVQDITYEFILPGDNDVYTITYADTVTAGNETFVLVGTDITVNIESGVSTATQVAAAAALNLSFTGAVTTTITGTAGNAQVAAAAVNFAGGENPGTAKAASLIGDVEIQGALSFSGALSIGALSAFASQAVVNGGGSPTSINSIVSNPTVAASATVSLADTIGTNTAMLLTVGDSATVTTAFLGISALALPAVVTLGSGATVDHVAGATFAISLDSGAGGGTIDYVDLCAALALPNGITAVNNLRAYYFDMPFGDVGTAIWGLYSKPASAHNYIAGDLVVGTSDTPTNSSVGIEIVATDKALLVSRMDSTAEGALTAVNGMIIYNTTTNKFRGYENGAWADLI